VRKAPKGRTNMKFIHCADIHLGSPLDGIHPEEKRKERQAELRASFERIASYAEENGVTAVIISGDLFDGNRPYKKDKTFFYSCVEAHPNVDFLYLKGNHDSLESYTEEIPNLKTFSKEWQTYEYGDVKISGIELDKDNCLSLYRTFPRKNGINIAVMHGMLCDDASEQNLDRRKLCDLGIDYLALGHVHYFKEEKLGSGVAVYSGCPEGRGYDETGKKGFILLDVNADGIKYEFVPFAKREVVLFEPDISECKDIYSVFSKVSNECGAKSTDMIRVELHGTVGFDTTDICSELEKLLEFKHFGISVKNKTTIKYDAVDFENDISVKGEFVRGIMANEEIDETEKFRIISIGLRALGGEEDFR